MYEISRRCLETLCHCPWQRQVQAAPTALAPDQVAGTDGRPDVGASSGQPTPYLAKAARSIGAQDALQRCACCSVANAVAPHRRTPPLLDGSASVGQSRRVHGAAWTLLCTQPIMPKVPRATLVTSRLQERTALPNTGSCSTRFVTYQAEAVRLRKSSGVARNREHASLRQARGAPQRRRNSALCSSEKHSFQDSVLLLQFGGHFGHQYRSRPRRRWWYVHKAKLI